MHKTQSGNMYIDVNLKVAVDMYETIRIMCKVNPSITENYLATLKEVPVRFTNVCVLQSGVKFFTTYRGGNIIKNVPVNFKYHETKPLSIAEIKTKKTGTYPVRGLLRWLKEKEEIDTTHKGC